MTIFHLLYLGLVFFLAISCEVVLEEVPTTPNKTTIITQRPTETPSTNTLEESNSNFNYLPTVAKGDKQIAYTYYTVSYSSRHKNAEWVAYELKASDIAKDDQPRRHSFKLDPNYKETARSSEYAKTGYDRGHLVPANDMNFSKKAMAETFYMTNVSPQVPEFNRGIWKSLEERVRKWAVVNEHLYIVTGPVLRKRITAKTTRLGENNDITVPTAYYKVILDYRRGEKKGIAFLLKNKDYDQDVERFACSIDKIEELTDLDFFPSLSTKEAQSLEGSFDINKWRIN